MKYVITMTNKERIIFKSTDTLEEILRKVMTHRFIEAPELKTVVMTQHVSTIKEMRTMEQVHSLKEDFLGRII